MGALLSEFYGVFSGYGINIYFYLFIVSSGNAFLALTESQLLAIICVELSYVAGYGIL